MGSASKIPPTIDAPNKNASNQKAWLRFLYASVSFLFLSAFETAGKSTVAVAMAMMARGS